jgi:transposase
VQTERRDAKKLAIDVADGGLRGLSVPTAAEARARLRPRTRAQMVEHRATLARQIKAKLHQVGLLAPASRRLLSNRYVRESAAWALPPELRVRLTLVAEQWRLATHPLSERRRLVRTQATAPAAREQVSRRVPGFGAVVARTVATELGARTRLAKERALCSSTELTPSAYASDSAGRRGPMSRQGSRRVRHGLIETAWRALPRDQVLQAMCDRGAATRGKKRAMVAMARRLMGQIRACVRHRTMYAVGTYASAPAHAGPAVVPPGSWGHTARRQSQRLQTAIRRMQGKEGQDGGSALYGARPSHGGMNRVTPATAVPSVCWQHCQHGRKCEAQEGSWS